MILHNQYFSEYETYTTDENPWKLPKSHFLFTYWKWLKRDNSAADCTISVTIWYASAQWVSRADLEHD